MFGLDDRIAALGSGEAFLITVAVAVLLGLRHATDPDHVTAMSTLVAGEARQPRRAGLLGLAWGAGHAAALFACGLPIVLFDAYLPAAAQTAAETAVGALIVALAVRLLVRWRRGDLRAHSHPHAADGRPLATRSPLQAFGIGLVHGVGGSAGVGLLLLAAIPDHVEGAVALALFATFTAVSMALASTSLGWMLSRGVVRRAYGALAPALGVTGLAFGTWYALGAMALAPYGL